MIHAVLGYTQRILILAAPVPKRWVANYCGWVASVLMRGTGAGLWGANSSASGRVDSAKYKSEKGRDVPLEGDF